MAESSFAVLNHIGVLPVDQSSEIRFSIDAYRGYRYASIRKYLTSGDYIGATRAGITMTPEIVKAVAPLLAALPDDFRQWQEDEAYKGWTKKGIRLPVEKIKEIKELFAKMAAALAE